MVIVTTMSKPNLLINSFIPKEKGSMPRILLLDFDDQTRQYLEDEGYEVYLGHTGFKKLPFSYPKHESEIEVVLWDTRNFRTDNKIATRSGDEFTSDVYTGNKVYTAVINTLKECFERMRSKGGFVGILLGNGVNVPEAIVDLPKLLGRKFSFGRRYTTTLVLNGIDDIWHDFYKRYIVQNDIKFYIDWNDNLVNFERYFEDEDKNIYAVSYDHFAIIPKIDDARLKDALSFMLQSVLPVFCVGTDIFPDKYYYRWANNDQYLPPIVSRLKKDNQQIEDASSQRIQTNLDAIEKEMVDAEYLTDLLIADDSNLFPENKKLGSSVHKILEHDLGFKVTDVDKMKLDVGESLKEDKWIEDTDYFALVEIKGTERGAKANWIKQDLTAHVREFEIVKEMSGIKSILVFNHERRDPPEERSEPFANDSSLMTFVKKTNMCLLPVYELFKLTRDVKEGEISPEEARNTIKTCTGMYKYSPKRLNVTL